MSRIAFLPAIFTMALFLSACAGGAPGYVGTSTLMPVPSGVSSKPFDRSKKRRRAKLGNCRQVRRQLRRLEKRGEIVSAAYDRAIDQHIRLGCDRRRS